MRHGKGRKKVYVRTKIAIDNYIEEHADQLAKKGVTASQLKTRAEEMMKSYYHGRKNFEKAVKKEINYLALTKEEFETAKAKSDAIFEGDKRQFNNKQYGAWVDKYIELDDETTITGYWEITGSDYVLAHIITENPYDTSDDGKSPEEKNEYLPRSYVGLV